MKKQTAERISPTPGTHAADRSLVSAVNSGTPSLLLLPLAPESACSWAEGISL